jgi:hypothetical protein
MSYLFIKNLFHREKFVLFSKKLKILKTKKKKTFLVGFLSGFFGWVFWVGFYCQPCLHVNAVPAVKGRVALFQLCEHAAEVGQLRGSG